ncbi:unnamed protein product [Nyctereutes procyonoides]|uniref:(raccoon dog) hypothetical protein n=1 Tax=Nyctereutes procyonoides TaxID=34880 RepID=A0A811YPW8_NYCPR|nr:unnamed protein product [Nyctereutes procyonoides]
MDFPGGPDQPPKLPEELEISSLLQETPAGPLQSTLEEPAPFLLGVEAQAKHPESPEETETPPLLQDAQSQPPEILKEAGNSVGPQEAPAEPSSTPEVQQEASAQPTEASEEVEPSTPQETPAQPPEEEVPPQEVNVPSLSQNEAQRPKLHNVTVKPVDLALTVTVTQPPQHPDKAEPSPVPQEFPAQPVELPEGAGPTLVTQEAPEQAVELPEEAGPTLVTQEAPAEPAQLPNEAESSTQQENPGQSPGEIESSATLQEQGSQPPELSLGEVEPIPTQQEHPAQHLEHHEVRVAPPGHHQVQHLNLPNITVKPADVQVTVTPEPTTEVGPLPVQHESVAQPSVPLNVEPLATQHEAPTLPPQSPEEIELLPFQQEIPTESPESPTQEKPPTQQETPVQTPGEVKPSTTQQDTLAQDSQAPEEGESPSTQEEALAQLPGTQEEKEPSPPQQEAPAELPQIPEEGEPSSIQEESQGHHAQTPEKAKPSSTQQEVPTQYPQASEEGEPSPTQEEAPTQFPQIHAKSESLTQEESQGQHPQTSEEVAPSPIQQEAPANHPQASEGIKPPLTQEESPTQHPQTPEVGEPSPTQTETPAKYPESLEDIEPVPAQSEATVQHPNPLGEVKPSATHQEAPHQHLQTYEEVNPSATQQEATAQHPEPSGEVEPSPTQQEVPAHSPEHHVVTVSPLGQSQAELLLFPSVTVKPLDLALIITPESTNEVETALPQQEASAQSAMSPEQLEPSAIQQEFPEQHPAPAENVEPSPVQQGVPTQTGDLPEETELSPSQQWNSSLPQMPVVGVKPSPVQPEHQAQPPESSTDIVAQPPVHHEVTFSSLGPGEAQHPMLPNITVKPVDLEVFITPAPTKFEQSPGQQETPAQAPVPPEQVEFSPAQSKLHFQSPETPEDEFPPGQQELIVQTKDPPKEVETSTMQETPGPPLEPPEEFVVQPPMYREMTVPTPGQDQARHLLLPNVTVQPLDLELTITPEPTTKVEHSKTVKKTTAPPKDLEVTFAHQEQVQAQHPILTEVTVQPLDLGRTITPEFTKEIELPQPMQETPMQLPEPPKEVTVAQSPVYQEETIPTPGRNQTQYPSSPNVTVQPLDLELTVSPEATTEVEHSTALKKTTAPPKDLEVTFAHLEQVLSHRPNLTKVTGQALDLELTITPESTTEIEPSPAMHLELPKELVAQPSIYQEAAVPTSAQDQAQHLWSPNVTTQPLALELTITLKPTTEVEQSTTVHQTTAPPKNLEVTFPPSEQVQVQHSTLNKVTVKPLDLGLTITPEPTTEIKPSPTMQETPTQPPEPPKEVVVQYPFHQKGAVPTLGQAQAPYPTSPSVTVHPVDMGRTITPEPTTQVERFTTTQTTTPPPKDLEMTLADLEQNQSQHPNLTEVTVPPMDLEITVTAGSNMEVEPSPAMQETPTQPPEPPKEVVVQYPFHQEVMIPTPSKGEGQHPESPSITFHHVGLGLTIIPEPITEAKHSATTKKTTAPYPADLEVTLAHSERVQSQQPNLTEVTVPVPPMDLEITVSHQLESSESVLPPTTQHSVVHFPKYFPEKAYTTLTEQPEQNVTTNVNICELCTCKDEMLSCSGFSPKQRLRRVPVPEPNMDNNTFTIL